QPEAVATITVTYTAGGAGTGEIKLLIKEQGCIKFCDQDWGTYDVTVTGAPVPPPEAPLSADIGMNPGDLHARRSCVTTGAGPAAAFQCGELRVVHSMPAYRTLGRDRTLSLIYNSGTATPYPIVMANVWRDSVAQPDSFVVELTVENNTHGHSYPGEELPELDAVKRVAVGFDAVADGLATGVYDYDLTVRAYFGAVPQSTQLPPSEMIVVNRRDSPYGAGWAPAGIAELYLNQPSGETGLLLVGADGSAAHYRNPVGQTDIWIAPQGAYRDTIQQGTFPNPQPDGTGSFSGYERRLLDGTRIYFDANGRQRWVTDRVGNAVEYTYVGTTGYKLNQIRIAPWESDKRYVFAYDATGNLDYVNDPIVRQLNLTVNASGDLVDMLDPDFVTRKITFDYNNHRMVGRTSRRGHETRFAYHGPTPLLFKDTLPGLPLSVTTFAPLASRGLALAPSGNTAAAAADTVIEIDGPRTDSADVAKFYANRLGAPTRIVDPYGSATNVTYHAGAPLLATRVATPNGAVRKNSYDSRFRLTAAIDSTHSAGTDSIIYEYEDPDQPAAPSEISSPLTATDRLVQGLAYNPDGTLNEVLVGNPASPASRTTLTYATHGLLQTLTEHDVPAWQPATETTVATDQTTALAYAPETLNLQTVTFDGRTTTYSYDTAGNVESVTGQGGRTTEFRYDAMNWQDSATVVVSGTSERLTTKFTYDEDGNRKTLTDPNTVLRSWTYHPRGMPLTMTDELSNVEQYFYDEANNLAKTIDRQGDSVWTVYDRLNRPRTRTIGEVKIDDTAELDTYEDVISEELADDIFVGRVLVPERATTITYGRMGRDSIVDNHAATIFREYTKEGAILRDSMYQKFGTNKGKALRYTYHRSGGRKTLQTEWRTYTYSYDPDDGSLATISYPASAFGSWTWNAGTITYGWDNQGRPDSVHLPSGVWATSRYDSGGRLANYYAQNSFGPITKSDFTYDASDDLTRLEETEGTGSTAFTGINDWKYDGAGRDTVQDYQGYAPDFRSFRYDANGNRDWEKIQPGSSGDSIKNVLVAGSNRLARRDFYDGGSLSRSKHYRYDKNGSQIREHWQIATVWVANDSYYDAAGQLILQQPTSDGEGMGCISENLANFRVCSNLALAQKIQTEFYYDGYGRRVGWRRGAAYISEFYDGDNVIEHENVEFLHGPGVDNPAIAFLMPNITCLASREAEYLTRNGRLISYHGGPSSSSGGGGVDCKKSDTGFVWSYFGQHAGAIDDSHSFSQSRASARGAPSTSYYRNRYYDAATGRFMHEDPIGHAGGINLYAYSGNAPAQLTDPFGLMPPCKDENGKPIACPAPVGPPPVALPDGSDGQPNEWVRAPGTIRRPVKWIPKRPVPSPTGTQPQGSWDPTNGHWDVDGLGENPGDRRRFLPDGTEVDHEFSPTPNTAPDPVLDTPEKIGLGGIIVIIVSEALRVLFPPRNLVPVP
ncbi:MAG: RHS repeat-associated core domain-containing protein, partial [Gemmatimonadota bacterium]